VRMRARCWQARRDLEGGERSEIVIEVERGRQRGLARVKKAICGLRSDVDGSSMRNYMVLARCSRCRRGRRVGSGVAIDEDVVGDCRPRG